MILTDTRLKAAKPCSGNYKMADGSGMYLLVKKNGHKYWRLDYRFRGKRKTLALGVYPEVSLKDAREKRRRARLQLETVGTLVRFARKKGELCKRTASRKLAISGGSTAVVHGLQTMRPRF